MYDEKSLSKKVGKKIGDWDGRSVYVCGKQDLKDVVTAGIYYLLYNDNNKLVYKTMRGWEVRGKVDREGNVTKVTSYLYNMPEEVKPVKEIKAAETKKQPVEKKKETEINIDEYIRKMNSLTIEEMLKGIRGKF